MKILLIYYTGTFNTRFLSKKVKERFLSRGDEVDIVEITSTTPCVDTNEYEDFLIDKIMKGDNEALEQLMLLDARELEKFQEFLALLPSYLGELARRRKTLDND